MKKTIVILTVLGFALVLGAVFAGDGFALTNDMSGTMIAMENGITVFDTRSVESGAGYMAWEPELAADNGITIFAKGPVSYDSGMAEAGAELVSAEGSAAGGLSEGEGLHLENGITIFERGAVDSN